jgi:hypothetical protein
MLIAAPAPDLSKLLFFAMPLMYAAAVVFLKSDPRTSSAAQDIS